jgi:hypothetical protein
MNMSTSNKNPDDYDLRRYLLGNLPETQREPLEQRLLIDSNFFNELLATEDDLVDEYQLGKLNKEELELFESHFSKSDEHQRKMQFGNGFHKYLDLEKVRTQGIAPHAAGASFLHLFRRRPGFVALAILTGILAVVCLSVFVYRHQTPSGNTKQIFAITLTPGSARAEGGNDSTRRLPRPSVNSSVHLQLEIAKDEYGSYRVDLFRENQLLTTFKGLPAQARDSHFVVNVAVDSSLLEVGDYRLKLSGMKDTDQAEFKDQYLLRVTQ